MKTDSEIDLFERFSRRKRKMTAGVLKYVEVSKTMRLWVSDLFPPLAGGKRREPESTQVKRVSKSVVFVGLRTGINTSHLAMRQVATSVEVPVFSPVERNPTFSTQKIAK